MKRPFRSNFPIFEWLSHRVFLRISRIARLVAFPAVFSLTVGILALTLVADQTIKRDSAKKHTFNAEDLPDCEVVLLLGCSEFLGNGNRNLYFKYRIDAAVQLYRSGRSKVFLASGDNGQQNYNEPEAMKAALIREGIPKERIYCDYAGFRTLDSVVRAKAIFGANRFVVVSQQFHNERAIFLAKQKGIEAYGYNAKDVASRGGLKTRLREKLARVKTLLDVSILNTQPRFLGSQIEITKS